MDELQYVIGLTDQLSGPAVAAASATEKLTDSLSKAVLAAGAADGKLRNAKGQFVASGQGASDGASAFSRGFDSIKSSALDGIKSLQQTDGALGAVTKALGAMGPEGEAAAAALQVVAAVVTFVVEKLYDLVQAAISISQQKDAMAETFKALGPAGSDGYALVGAMEAVADSLPQARGEVESWAKSLMAAGMQGEHLEQGVKAIASANAIMGKSGSDAAQTLMKRFEMAAESGQKITLDRRIMAQLAAAGVSAATLASSLGVPEGKLGKMSLDAAKLGDAMQKALIEKGAGALENMGLTWASISGKLGDAWNSLFEDMGTIVKPFMAEIKAFFAEFSAGGIAAGATKSVLTSMLTEVFSQLTAAAHAAHIMYLGLEIGALRAYIAAAPLVRLFRMINGSAAALEIVKSIFIGIAVVVGILAAAVAAVGLVIAAAGYILYEIFIAPIVAIVELVAAIVGFASDAIDALSTWASGASDAASNFVSGLVNGISNGASAVISAVSNLANGALSAFKGIFGIHSPSRVMLEHGEKNIAGAAATGIDNGAPMVDEAMGGLGPKNLTRGGGKPNSSGNSNSHSITFSGCTFGGDTTESKLRGWIGKYFEEMAGEGPQPA